MTLTDLAHRDGLPDDLRALIRDFPRTRWAGQTGAFTTFYLDRHELFRRMTERMRGDVEAALSREIAAPRHAVMLSRMGGQFLSALHGHHQIEDDYYFPRLAQLEKPVAHAFDLLEADHQALDLALHDFQVHANAVIEAAAATTRGERPAAAARDAAGVFHEGLLSLEALLSRHLEDEEDIVVPLMLKYGEASVEH